MEERNSLENLEELRGSVESITFRNEENSFTVLELSSGEALVTVKGVLPQISPGEELRLLGRTEHNPTWGRQFAAQFCERRLPGTQGELLKYLSSGVIKGVGPAMARRIVEALGDDAFSALENNPAKLAEIKGISPKKAEEICEGFKKQFSLRQVMIALERLGMTTAECLRVHKAFGTRAPELIKKNPYVLCEAELGIRFERADHIARAMPEPPDAAFRTQAGVLHVLRRASYDGHSCYPEEQTIAPCVRLLQCGDGQVREAIQILLEQRRLLRHHFPEGAFLFLPYLFNAEQGIAQKMEFLLRYPPAATKLSGDLSEVITRMEDKHAIHYAPEQREAMRIALERGLLILTGGPGTGKTTTLRGILELLRRGGLKVSLAAPTGRAAKRMQDLTDENAKTIHRLLEVEWTPDDRQTFARNRRNPLDTHAVIIDEISMVDVPLFSALLDALPLGCRLVLVGDADQLPPVGAGSVLQDLLRARQLPVVRLETIFRQAMESLIVTNSHRIVRGEMPELGCKDRDFFFLERGSVFQAAELTAQLCAERLPKAYGFDALRDIQVLCPSRKGETGTMKLNERLQAILNPKQRPGAAAPRREVQIGRQLFREGDKVMQIKNNYDLSWKRPDEAESGSGIYNGDIGFIEKVNPAAGLFKIRFDDERLAEYPFESAEELEHAYAITVHKSQGSEFNAVILPVLGIAELLAYRNLLYTAVTRARKLLILVGSQGQVRRMVENASRARRYSGLAGFLAEMVHGDVALPPQDS